MGAIRLRVRTPSGMSTFTSAGEGSTFAELSSHCTKECGEASSFERLAGYPPTKLAWTEQMPLSSLVRSGDTIVVKPTAAPPVVPQSTAVSEAKAPTAPVAPQLAPTHGGDGERVVRRVIAADNSCLFNSVAYILEGGSKTHGPKLRQVVADVVRSSDEYCEAVLGQPPEDYANWILGADHWGGALELAILSEHYKTELAAFDVQSQRVDIYGQGRGYTQRAFLLYDGIHYDAMAKQLFTDAPAELDVTVFDADDPLVVEQAREVCGAAHNARAFTDTGKFTIRCLVCQRGLTGEKEAVQHAKESGHTNFS